MKDLFLKIKGFRIL